MKNLSQKTIVLYVVIAALLVGGTLSAFAMFFKSAKYSYLNAEKNNIASWQGLLTERYAEDLKWYDYSLTKKMNSNAEMNIHVPEALAQTSEDDFGMNPLAFVNTASLLVSSESDMKNTVMNNTFTLALAGTEAGSVDFDVNKHDLTISSDFTTPIKISDTKINELMTSDDMPNPGIDFEKIFSGQTNALPLEDTNYLTSHYSSLVINNLDDKLFAMDKEDATVYDKNIKATKLTVTLSDEDMKKLTKAIVNEVANDEKTQDILKRYIRDNALQFDMDALEVEAQLNQMFDDLADAEADIDEMDFPKQLVSTIWVDKHDTIVKRDMTLTVDDDMNFTLVGERNIDGANSQFEYTAAQNDETIYTINGALNFDGKEVNDTVALYTDFFTLTYNAEEKIDKDKTRNFSRSFTFEDSAGMVGSNGAFVWDGTQTSSKEAMTSENVMTFSADVLADEVITLTINSDAKLVKKVEPRVFDNVVDFNGKSADDINAYMSTTLMQEIFSHFGGF